MLPRRFSLELSRISGFALMVVVAGSASACGDADLVLPGGGGGSRAER